MKYNYLDVSPSELNTGVHCRSHFAMMRQRISLTAPVRGAHMRSLAGFLPPDTLYEVQFPQGFRVDAWIPSESLAIEYKSGAARRGDILQCWLMMDTMAQAGVPDFSMQLWYEPEYRAQAAELARDFGFELRRFGGEVLAIRIMFNSTEHKNQLDAALSDLRSSDIDTEVFADTDPLRCGGCHWYDFCHI
jgi:hypothetical protein